MSDNMCYLCPGDAHTVEAMKRASLSTAGAAVPAAIFEGVTGLGVAMGLDLVQVCRMGSTEALPCDNSPMRNFTDGRLEANKWYTIFATRTL